MKKLTSVLTALLCLTNLSLPVSAKYYDSYREAAVSTDLEHVIVTENRVYMPPYSVQPKYAGYVITTDGTALTQETADFSGQLLTWDEYYTTCAKNQSTFKYLAQFPVPSDSEHSYVLLPSETPSDAEAVLRTYIRAHDFVSSAFVMTKLDYFDSYFNEMISIVAPSGTEYTQEDFPELAVLGEGTFFKSYVKSGTETDGETAWDFQFDFYSSAAEKGLTSNKEIYYFIKDIETQLNQNHPEIDAVAWFGHDYSAEDDLFLYDLIPVSDIVLTGDLDLDGRISILDVITLNKAVLGKEVLSAEQNQAADVNHDNTIDSEDSLLIMKYIVGLVEYFS